MSDFPSGIMPPYKEDCTEKLIKLQDTSPFEAGYTQSRAVHTVEKYRFTIGWQAGGGLPTSEWDLLKAHYVANVGGSFNWTHWDGGTYVVRYGGELPEAKRSACGNYRIVSGLILDEV